MTSHLINRVTILGTGLIGGSFALALRKYATDLHITGWDRPAVTAQAGSAIEAVVHLRHQDGQRCVTEVAAVLPGRSAMAVLPALSREPGGRLVQGPGWPALASRLGLR